MHPFSVPPLSQPQCQQLFNWVEGSEWLFIPIISQPNFLPLPVYIPWMIIIINILLTLLFPSLPFLFNYTPTLVKLHCLPSLHLCPTCWMVLEKINNHVDWTFPKFMITNLNLLDSPVSKSPAAYPLFETSFRPFSSNLQNPLPITPHQLPAFFPEKRGAIRWELPQLPTTNFINLSVSALTFPAFFLLQW